MAIKIKDSYLCGYCNKKYKTQPEADGCKESHKLIYVPISREDLNRLVNFIYLKEDKLLTNSLVETIVKYSKSRIP